MNCYLDNCATTRPDKEICDLVAKTMYELYGNPSSMHILGFEAEKLVKQARTQIAKTLKCKEKNIVFTSGGTESNNMALIGAAMANKRAGKHIVTTCFEHASVYNPLGYLENMGFEVTYLPVDSMGHVNPDTLADALRDDTIIVSIMSVNNEVGSVLDIEALAKIVKEKNEKIIFHTDAIQAYGKMKIFPSKIGVDLMSVSGHKFHAPKGTGFLYVGDGVKIHPYIHGGGQQNNMRSGTENVPGIVGLGMAAQNAYDNILQTRKKLFSLKSFFIKKIMEIPGTTVNAWQESFNEMTACHIISVSFDKVRSEVLLHALEDKGVYVSAGSACSSNHPGISGALLAIGVKKEMLETTLRFSICKDTTEVELQYCIDCLNELLPVLSKYVRK